MVTTAPMDSSNRRPQLPALSYLDIDQVKREDEMAYKNRAPGTAPGLPPVTAPSPTSYHLLGPPPPYTHTPSQHPSTWPAAQSDLSPPHDSRRPSEDDQEGNKQIPRQSLPSLSEALGVESQTPYAGPAVPSPMSSLPAASAHPARTQLAAIASPSPSLKRSHGMDTPQQTTSNAYSALSSHHSSQPQYQPESHASQTLPPPPTAVEALRSSYSATTDRPLLHVQTSQPAARPAHSSTSLAPEQSPVRPCEQPATQPRTSMAPPSLPYGYTPYAPRQSTSVPSRANTGPIYQPSITYPAPSASSAWKHDNMHSKFEGREYGEAVKNHLDLFDLGNALQEIASTSRITSDFARRYEDQLHQPARSGPIIQSLPGLVEVDDMISKSRVQLESLLRIRDFVVNQQAAYEQEAADQRQHKMFADQAEAESEQFQDGIDGKSRLGSIDAKKRRGRAAPPGRCHSCNRAETPEWRRGPDGARTLCNACGLHYAKLTRKQQGTNKAAAVGTSNLRPKE